MNDKLFKKVDKPIAGWKAKPMFAITVEDSIKIKPNELLKKVDDMFSEYLADNHNDNLFVENYVELFCGKSDSPTITQMMILTYFNGLQFIDVKKSTFVFGIHEVMSNMGVPAVMFEVMLIEFPLNEDFSIMNNAVSTIKINGIPASVVSVPLWN